MSNQDHDTLEATLMQLGESKKDFISQEAVDAKVTFDELKRDLDTDELSFDDPEDDFPSRADIDLFNDNIKVLLAVFRYSRFDEFIRLLGKPHHLYITQLLMGFFKGAGLVIGVIAVLTIIAFVFGENTLLSLLV